MLEGKTNEFDKILAQRIRMRRISLGVSQQELGKQIGVSIQQIQKYERAVNRVSCSRIVEIAKVLKKPIVYFFEDSNQEEILRETVEEVIHQDKNFIKLMKYFNKISNKKIAFCIIELVKILSLVEQDANDEIF